MNVVRVIFLAIALTSVGAPAWAAQDDPHQGHHPAAPAPTPAMAPAVAPNSASDPSSMDMARMDSQMKAMHEMHGKIMAARTPDERNALMAEHMKAMQDGMSMMSAMFPGGTANMPAMKGMPASDMGDMKMTKGASRGGMADMKGDMAQHHRMMEKRMDMMQAMMQMMMDRLPPPPAK